MSSDCLKLTVYFGEHDRLRGRLVSDLLLDVYERHRIRGAILVRATEGFGIKHQLHTQRLLTLSEDLPLVSIAVDTRAAIEGLVPEAQGLVTGGLVTLERARLADASDDRPDTLTSLHDETKLTLFLGRRERIGGRPAFDAVVDSLWRHGVSGASVVLGVDGLVHGARRRARFLSTNADVPLVVVSVGAAARLAEALAELRDRLQEPLITIERVRVLKRGGEALADLEPVPDTDPTGLSFWQKLTVYTGEHARHGRHPLSIELIHRLRLEGAAGATAVRGIWGFSGDHPPHGDRLRSIRRRVPVVVSLVDRPEAAQRWWPLIDELTSHVGLVTSELVPAFEAVGPSGTVGGLRLAGSDPGRRY